VNDAVNKIREKVLENIIASPIEYLQDIDYVYLRVELKILAGRGNNHDANLLCPIKWIEL
jgi:hypothetical protein